MILGVINSMPTSSAITLNVNFKKCPKSPLSCGFRALVLFFFRKLNLNLNKFFDVT